MAASILDVMAEDARRNRTGDDSYNRRLPWVFRLRTKPFSGPTGADGEALFPLPIAPEQFDYELPFAQQLAPQQESGVVVEEAGIVIGTIKINATTGFKLRRNNALTVAASGGKFTGLMGTAKAGVSEEISGQLSFWILANRCFEAYSELKKDPEIAKQTYLELHVVKDALHLAVIPKRFRLTRSSGKERVTYRYEVELAVVGEADAFFPESASEKSLLDEVADTINSVRQAVQGIAAVLDDVTAAIGEITRVFSGITGIVDDLKSIMVAGTALVQGTKNFFDIPKNMMDSVTGAVESAAELFEETLMLPADVAQSMRNIGDSLDQLKVAARDHYTEAWENVAKSYNADTEQGLGATQSTEFQAQINAQAEAGASSGGQMGIDQAFGSIRPGDKARQAIDKNDPEDRLGEGAYNGISERVVGQGDTVQSLAAKHLGDARKWLDLVVVNRLRAPYITNGARIPGTLRTGDTVLIPIARPTAPQAVLTTGDVVLGKSQADVHLGADFELQPVAGKKGKFGWAVDTEHGAVDARKISGISNLGQGLAARLRTTRGENIMFPRLGLPRLIGAQQLGDATVEARFRVRQQILADPRVFRLIEYRFEVEADALVINAQVQPIGFNTARAISRVVT